MTVFNYDWAQTIGARAVATGVNLLTQPGDAGLVANLGHAFAEHEDYPISGLVIGWCSEWFRLGSPTVGMGHKYLAALVSTAVPDFEIHAPWRHFMIRVPDRSIVLVNGQGVEECVESIAVIWYPDRWTYIAFAERCEYSQIWTDTATLRRGDSVVAHKWPSPFQLDMTSVDERARVLLDRLVLNTCVVMTGDPTQVHELGKRKRGEHHAMPGATRAGGRYELRRDIRVDCRQTVHDYLSGARRSAPAVRFLVRGHMRQQPHGPERALRRTQWIEPFWKGATDAPVAFREYSVQRTPEEVTAKVAE